MSKTLTYYYKNYTKSKINRTPIIVCILCVLLVVIFTATAVVISNNKVKTYGAKVFYLVYAGKYTILSKATEMCTKVSDKGGAGIIYTIGNTKFVVASSYFLEEDAKKVEQQISTVFSDVGVLKISSPKLSKSVCNKIEKIAACKLYYKTYYNFCCELYNLTIKVDKGELTDSDVYKSIMQTKQNIVQISENLKTSTDSIGKAMYSSSLLADELIGNFFNSAFISNSVAKNLKKLYINSIIEFIDMCESIK